MRTPDETVEVLLIEDNPDDAVFFSHTFGKCGVAARLRVVKDGAEALEFAFGTGSYAGRDTSQQPKLIVLDLKLPKVDGLGVLQSLKHDPRTQSIPVVVLSSSLEGRDLAASYRLGANSYLLKPMDFNQFGEAVHTLVWYWLEMNQTPRL